MIAITNTERRAPAALGEFGIVYQWYDRAKNKRYIGSHWHSKKCKFPQTGACNYVCSSRQMKSAYQKRPDDFTKEILAVVTTSKEDLLRREQTWLDRISDQQFGKSFYNLNKTAKGWRLPKEVNSAMRKAYWAADPHQRHNMSPEVRERISASVSKGMKVRWQDPVYRAKQLDCARTRGPCSTETRAKISASVSASHARHVGQKRGPYKPYSPEVRARRSAAISASLKRQNALKRAMKAA